MPNGRLEPSHINNACLMLLAEWNKQEKEHKYKNWRLRELFRLLGGALVYERDRVQLLIEPPKGESVVDGDS